MNKHTRKAKELLRKELSDNPTLFDEMRDKYQGSLWFSFLRKILQRIAAELKKREQ